MSKKLYVLVGLMVIVAMLAGCAPAAEEAAPEEAADECALKVVNLLNGVQGDKSFFDSAVRGTTQAEEEYGVCVKVIEAGIDPAKWQPALEDAAANEEYDILIIGTFQMTEFLQVLAQDYPDKKFMIYDAPVNYEDEANDVSNVYSVTYKQNEGSYLAGFYAGLMTETGTIGVVGGQDIPVINDFIVGYKQGAVDAGVEDANVIIQYAGSWNDPAKGKEIALAMYQQGADIVFQVAGGTGVGVFEAAKEMDKWAIGVDSDQATIIEETQPDQAARILTSMMKNVDHSLYRALGMAVEGTLPYGTVEALGVEEGGVGLAYNKFFDENTPDDVKAKLEEVQNSLLAGEITVETVFK
jgi:basic membrane protein A and related proteins